MYHFNPLNRKIMRLMLVASILLTSVFIAQPRARTTHAAASQNVLDLSLNLSGLDDLGANFVYEGWLIVNGSPVSTGRFTVDGSGVMSQTQFQVAAALSNASTFVLTIEPQVDPDPAPASTHLLAGNIVGQSAALSLAHPAALGDDFTGASGSYILAAPTSSGSDGAAYYNGIWFLAAGAASLNLPTLPAGWAYEGWVVNNGTPISTGTFTSASGADSDGGGITAGTNAAPPFPGQDFINPLTDIRGGAAVISIEPVPDNSPAPFTLKPLVDGSIDDTGAAGISQDLGNNAASAPTGTVTFGESIRVVHSCTGLEDLGPGFVYESWLIDANGAQSGGRFTVDGSGNLSQTEFTASVSGSDDVTTYVLTIEPDPDPSPAPAATHLLGGSFANNIAAATIGHGAALGNDFTAATGSYILAAPTSDGSDGAAYYNGIWFLNAGAASLSLPTLPAGWAYEGWVVNNGTPISTGTFTSPASADSDGGGSTAGTNAAPPFPGQDFINPLTDIRGGAAVISIEPVPDNSPAPFTLKPLVDGTIDDTGAAGISQALSNNAAGAPTCSIEIGARDALSVGLASNSAETPIAQASSPLLLTVAVAILLTAAIVRKERTDKQSG